MKITDKIRETDRSIKMPIITFILMIVLIAFIFGSNMLMTYLAEDTLSAVSLTPEQTNALNTLYDAGDYEGLIKVARAAKEMGCPFLRGGAFKPRTSPYDFQGLEEKGLQYLAQAREETGLLVVTEVMDTLDLPLVCDYADVIQVGARNMQNFELLKELGDVVYNYANTFLIKVK